MDDKEYPETKKSFIKGNTLYLFSLFDEQISNNVIPDLDQLISTLSMQKDPVLEIVISSAGGYFDELIALLFYINKAKANGIKVITKVISSCASAATLLSCFGDERYMSKYADQLLHYGQIYGDKIINPIDVERTSENYKKHFEKLIDIYASHSKLNKKQLRSLLTTDYLYLDANKCLEYGLIDFII